MAVKIKQKTPEYGSYLGSSSTNFHGMSLSANSVTATTVVAHHKEDGQVATVAKTEELAKVLSHKPMGKIGVSMGRTFASESVPFLKKYESLKVDVWLSLPTDQENLQENFDFVSDWVSGKLAEVQKSLEPQVESPVKQEK